MAPSLANRSFLYGPAAAAAAPSPAPDKLKPVVPPKPAYLVTSLINTRNVLRILEPVKPIEEPPPPPPPPVENNNNSDTDQIYEYNESDQREHKKKSSKKRYAKNFLHYVPKRYYRKSRNLATKSLSLKSLTDKYDQRTLRSRSLSREELKYVTISLPSNFTHVASATSKLLIQDNDKVLVTEHEQKYADLRGGTVEYAEIGLPGRKKEYEEIELPLDRTKVYAEIELKEKKKDYEEIGLPIKREYAEVMKDRNEVYAEVELPVARKEEYEAVEKDKREESRGPVVNSSFLEAWRRQSQVTTEKPAELEDDDGYDDVGPPVVTDTTVQTVQEPASDDKNSTVESNDDYDDVGPPDPGYEHVYDDVVQQPPKPCEEETSTPAPQEEEDIYDHVGLPLRRPRKEDHERVNSLYVGLDKESEWEDLEDPVYANILDSKPAQPEPSNPHIKKKPGRWSRNKVSRQRSRASRKSSARSTSRSRTRVAVREVCRDVAVSLGTGSVLLIGAIEDDRQKVVKDDHQQRESRGLVQLRLLLEDDTQESSLYIAEDSSDDSNYETLETYEPDDFSSDEDASLPATRPQHLPGLIPLDQAPYRAVPPAPSATLGHSFGRHIKMLRHTWSITKGSLGRHMARRRSDVPSTTTTPESPSGSSGGGADLARKYFSFKKHFRKSQATLSSTFYLDKEEPIYSNGDWYKEVGLYASLPPFKRMSEPPPPPPNPPPAPYVDHYSVLAEEPLYQFYTAAATRVAFESDSDGYEEVEELSPSTATTELARPGHRTLWCQTPQVITRGLLQKLTMEERKIQEAKFEILTSEASYLNSLRVLENEFASNQELVHEVLTPVEWEKLFGAVPDVLLTSERFLAELESIWHEDPMLTKLPELLLKHGEKSANVYVNYCSNQVSIDTTLKELKARRGIKFLETVSRIEMHPACHHLSLHSFLMLPMQRITRLPLLADAVLSKLSVEHPERLSWERVLANLSDIVGRCNEGARLAERRNEMDALARKLEYPPKMEPVSLHDKELIRSGLVTQLSSKADTEYKLTFGKKFHKTPLMLMLLTDYLLVTKLKSNSNEETYTVMETCKRSLVALESAPEDSPFAGRHAMILTLLENHANCQVEYVLTCENDTEKERWLDAVSPPKPTCVGETLYESWDCPQVMALYSYPPRQPDELALQPGDVINVLRKMNDGWLYGEKLLDGEQGWFPGNFTKEVASEHVRARNLRQRHRLLALNGSVLQRKAKQSLSLL